MEALIAFTVGVLVGIGATIALVYRLGAKAISEKKAKLQVAKKQADSLDARMKRVKDITKEQLALAQQADGPQKNGLDGKYKNGLIGQIKKLEEERNDVMRSLLKDGYDPELTTMDESGTVTRMKLSEYMAYMGINMEPTKPVKTAEQIGKFTVIRGGRDDDGGGETTH